MKKKLVILGGVVILLGAIAGGAAYKLYWNPYIPPVDGSFYDFKVKTIDGQEQKLDAYKGKVVLVVNTASKCGYTPQYEGLQKLYDLYKDQGFVILGFPANNFMNQEPGTDQEIKEFCSLNYKVTFPMFSKISVRGDDEHPLYRWLTGNPKFNGNIMWNFEKFLIDRNGTVIDRFGTRTTPSDPKVVAEIEKALSHK